MEYKTERLNLRVTKTELEQLQKLAKKKELAVSELIMLMINNYLNE